MNGQVGGCEIARALARVVRFERVVETGTYRGTTTEFLSAIFGAPVLTVEKDLRCFTFASRRLSTLRGVTVHLGDSRDALRDLVATKQYNLTTFFYLDAHWNADLPLGEEVRLIQES